MNQPPAPPPPPPPPPSGPPYEPPFGQPYEAFPPPGGPPPDRTAGKRVVIVVALLTLGVLLAGTAVFLVIRDVTGGGGGGPADLREPMTFQQVADTSPPPCGSGTVPDTEGACLRLGPERMIVDRVERIEAVPPEPESGQARWAVQLDLTPADGAAFGRLTGKAAEQPEGSPGRRIAMIVGGKVVSAPSVSGGPITGGTVMISGQYTRADAEDLVARMTGR
ncbi:MULTISPECIES: SecDF P1 head subdomain-containing protein [unclassified Spirillospora]|uniref:SecDF P1 head subdomain-containing protein n=1 Tax=unclassified Spirillospora TaxID=2642701 RepID=UPI0037187C34